MKRIWKILLISVACIGVGLNSGYVAKPYHDNLAVSSEFFDNGNVIKTTDGYVTYNSLSNYGMQGVFFFKKNGEKYVKLNPNPMQIEFTSKTVELGSKEHKSVKPDISKDGVLSIDDDALVVLKYDCKKEDYIFMTANAHRDLLEFKHTSQEALKNCNLLIAKENGLWFKSFKAGILTPSVLKFDRDGTKISVTLSTNKFNFNTFSESLLTLNDLGLYTYRSHFPSFLWHRFTQLLEFLVSKFGFATAFILFFVILFGSLGYQMKIEVDQIIHRKNKEVEIQIAQSEYRKDPRAAELKVQAINEKYVSILGRVAPFMIIFSLLEAYIVGYVFSKSFSYRGCSLLGIVDIGLPEPFSLWNLYGILPWGVPGRMEGVGLISVGVAALSLLTFDDTENSFGFAKYAFGIVLLLWLSNCSVAALLLFAVFRLVSKITVNIIAENKSTVQI